VVTPAIARNGSIEAVAGAGAPLANFFVSSGGLRLDVGGGVFAESGPLSPVLSCTSTVPIDDAESERMRELRARMTESLVGGAFTAPTVSVVPGIGVEIVVLSFAVIVIGGMGSLPGAALGAVIVGLVRSAAIHYAPAVELFVIYFVMALVLAFRPRGLFSLAEPRKI